MEEMKNAYKSLVGNTERKGTPEDGQIRSVS
jgi:hypothetical protein